jgi:hypothetical protein
MATRILAVGLRGLGSRPERDAAVGGEHATLTAEPAAPGAYPPPPAHRAIGYSRARQQTATRGGSDPLARRALRFPRETIRGVDSLPTSSSRSEKSAPRDFNPQRLHVSQRIGEVLRILTQLSRPVQIRTRENILMLHCLILAGRGAADYAWARWRDESRAAVAAGKVVLGE